MYSEAVIGARIVATGYLVAVLCLGLTPEVSTFRGQAHKRHRCDELKNLASFCMLPR